MIGREHQGLMSIVAIVVPICPWLVLVSIVFALLAICFGWPYRKIREIAFVVLLVEALSPFLQWSPLV